MVFKRLARNEYAVSRNNTRVASVYRTASGWRLVNESTVLLVGPISEIKSYAREVL